MSKIRELDLLRGLQRTHFAAKRAARYGLERTPIERLLLFRYPFMFSPPQLAYLLRCLDDVRDVDGPIFEIGCAWGVTTTFLNLHLLSRGISRPYICIDTFSGFTDHDIQYEVRHRGKSKEVFGDRFRSSTLDRFRRTMRLNGLEDRVTAIQHDASSFDFAPYGDIAFALVDVDLYRPTVNLLPRIYERLAPGGRIVVDDCQPSEKWDGALEAYSEFVADRQMPCQIVEGKLGVIDRPRRSR